jgi:heme/copper-type cytochrome/quinol oxidase subunit 4
MRHHFRLVAILAVCLCAYGVLLAAFRLMNQPRDTAVLAGLAVIFCLLLLVPVAVRTIWRRL